MTALRTAILIAWGAFWIYWLISAIGVKEGSRCSVTRRPGLVILILVVVLSRVFRGDTFTVHGLFAEVVGAVIFASGIALAIWARIHLGRNWGMPMTEKKEPELVTSGPYRLVRHPIYSGILLGMLGSALAVNGYWLIVAAFVCVYFVYSARVEERLMTNTFPTTYPSYRAHTKMLIPYLL